MTQVVPAVDSYASTILKYKTALAKYFPGVPPDYVSLEGYVAGSLLLEGLKRAVRSSTPRSLVEALETVRDFDMGLGAPISFGPTEHQGIHKVWGTQLNENGRYQADRSGVIVGSTAADVARPLPGRLLLPRRRTPQLVRAGGSPDRHH